MFFLCSLVRNANTPKDRNSTSSLCNMAQTIFQQTSSNNVQPVIGCYFCSYFCLFSNQLHSTFLTPPFFFMIILVMFPPLCFHAHKPMTRTQFDWYNRTPNNSSTGLPTFQNSLAEVPLHPDPVLEPPPPPPNTPTTQSSGLPGHRVRVGVCPPHEDCELSKGSLLLPQQDRPD